MTFRLFAYFQQCRNQVCGGVETGTELAEAFLRQFNVILQRVDEVLRGVIQWSFIYSKVDYLKIIKSFALPIGKAHYQIHILINSVKTLVYELFIISIVMLFLRGRTLCRN